MRDCMGGPARWEQDYTVPRPVCLAEIQAKGLHAGTCRADGSEAAAILHCSVASPGDIRGHATHGTRHQQGHPGRQPRQRPRNQIHPGRHGDDHGQPGHHQRAQGQGRATPRNAPNGTGSSSSASSARSPASTWQGQPGLHRRLDPLRQVHRPGRRREVLHRHHRRRDADARRSCGRGSAVVVAEARPAAAGSAASVRRARRRARNRPRVAKRRRPSPTTSPTISRTTTSRSDGARPASEARI